MIRKNNKIVAYILAGAIAFMSLSSETYATTLPSAGAAVTIDTEAIETVADNKAEETTAEEGKTGEKVEIQLSAGEACVDPIVASVQSDENGEVVNYTSAVDLQAEIEEYKEKEEFSNLVIAKCNDYVNVRKEADEEAEVLGKLYNESVGEFISESNGWYEIKSGNVTGFVKAEYVVTGDDAVALAKEVGRRIATVDTETLFVRQDPTTESDVVGMAAGEDKLTVKEEEGLDGWVKVSIEEGEGYVSTDYVELSTEFVKAESKEEEEARLAKEEAERKQANAAAAASGGKASGGSSYSSSGGGAGSAVANFACQFVGNPYVYGGSSLTNGTDCSGFVMSVYANFGVGLPHSSGALRGCGYDVGGLGNAQPGDIVCYSGHVGIYIGGGQIVHASTAATGIKISNAGYRDVLSVRRIF
ncbi:MAG: NlpC/P60 family protein [Lachnospiraceae bacterium]|jgi:cell wall-associated NlpC family hydrolase|nr:NlpC/P60 family protein [Lachnospiraceae bacterium]